ncbi:type I secretion system permease/ATPase [Aliarcobacter butzleri]|uniref:type I secretion system permease/ATPase n=1 Tax=Aliarcobacter butzleri TaxID=28197 RepID=UPI0021B4C6DE|nr:type I secretion system permease/ATPase [Aliarcobacter butzleri]MCT7550192.1 type I secretion system permease/ATPase [Aliarcobacter butzleri]MCT7558024.1 type I secretion system permease/ATPase [Aliarcobacter butzleri]
MVNRNLRKNDSLLECLVLYTRLFHKPFSSESLLQGLPLGSNLSDQMLFSKNSSKSMFSRAAARAGLKTTIIEKPIKNILSLQLPVILFLSNENSCILDSFNEDKTKAKIIFPGVDDPLEDWVDIEKLEAEYLGYAFMLKKAYEYEHENGKKTLDINNQKHWFWSTLGFSKSIYLDCILASILINLFVLATPLFTMNVYDRVIPNNAQETLVVFTVGIVIVFLLDGILKFLRTYFLEIAAKKSDIIMSSIIFEKVLDLQLSSHPKSVGSFANNLKSFDSIRGFLTNSTLSVLVDFPFAILFLIVIFYLSGVLVFIPIFIIFLIVIYAKMIKDPLKASIESTYEASAKKNGILIEALQNIETIKAQGMQGNIQYNWEESTGEIANKSLKSKVISASIPTVTGILVGLNTVLIICFGVYQIQEFHLTMGGLIATMILSGRAIAPMGQIVSLITNYEDTKQSFKMLDDIVNRPIERPLAKEFVKRPALRGNIEFRNVSFKYPDSDLYALKNVSFSIKEGEKVAFIGRIGSGKSTIAKLLLKLYEPESGSILIDGIDISQIDPADLRQKMSYVPQDVHLFRDTIKKNILGIHKFVDDEWMLKCSKISGTDEFVKLHPIGYDMPIGERGQGLSGGQRQSVAIARALINNADIWLFDEPTNAMDQTSEMNVLKNLKENLEEKTLLIVTQKMNMLDLVSRVIVMNYGEKVLDGKKEDVVKKLGGVSND